MAVFVLVEHAGGTADDISRQAATLARGYAEAAGQPLEAVLFGRDECARCHAAPAKDLTGMWLYEAVCEMCHGPLTEYATSLPPEVLEAEALRSWIADGRGEGGMPGYAESKGGPLDDAQIDTLVEIIGAASEGDPPAE